MQMNHFDYQDSDLLIPRRADLYVFTNYVKTSQLINCSLQKATECEDEESFRFEKINRKICPAKVPVFLRSLTLQCPTITASEETKSENGEEMKSDKEHTSDSSKHSSLTRCVERSPVVPKSPMYSPVVSKSTSQSPVGTDSEAHTPVVSKSPIHQPIVSKPIPNSMTRSPLSPKRAAVSPVTKQNTEIKPKLSEKKQRKEKYSEKESKSSKKTVEVREAIADDKRQQNIINQKTQVRKDSKEHLEENISKISSTSSSAEREKEGKRKKRSKKKKGKTRKSKGKKKKLSISSTKAKSSSTESTKKEAKKESKDVKPEAQPKKESKEVKPDGQLKKKSKEVKPEVQLEKESKVVKPEAQPKKESKDVEPLDQFKKESKKIKPKAQPLTAVSSARETLKQEDIQRKDAGLFESLDQDIVLDTNILQSIASELARGSKSVNEAILGKDFTKKLIEIEKKDQTTIAEEETHPNEPVVISDVAKKVVEALTTSHVLGKVLTTEEASILKSYFNRQIPLSEKVLATLDTALDKILNRAHEFYSNKAELDEFLKDRPKAKSQLLDALIAKKSNYLADLMSDANMYAEMISEGIVDAYQLASKGVLVLRDNVEQLQEAAIMGLKYSHTLADVGVSMTYDAAVKSKALADMGVSMTYDAAVKSKALANLGVSMSYDAAVKSKALADMGVSMTYDAAARGKALATDVATLAQNGATATKDIAVKGVELTKDAATTGAAIAGNIAQTGGAVAYGTATAACDVAGKQITEQGFEMAAKGYEMTKDIAQDAAEKGKYVVAKGTEMFGKSLESAVQSVHCWTALASMAYSQAAAQLSNTIRTAINYTDTDTIDVEINSEMESEEEDSDTEEGSSDGSRRQAGK